MNRAPDNPWRQSCRRTLHRCLVAAFLVFGAAACGRNPPPSNPGQSVYGDANVTVRNNNWMDMNVYALRNGHRVRLGTVGSMRTQTFRLPSSMLWAHDLRLMVDPIGSSHAFASQPILLSPGQAIYWTLENHLPLSSLTVR